MRSSVDDLYDIEDYTSVWIVTQRHNCDTEV
jgi:hypothetical protein